MEEQPKPLWRLSKELQNALVQHKAAHGGGNGGSPSSGSVSPTSGAPAGGGFGDPTARAVMEARDAPDAAGHVRWGRLALPGQLLRHATGRDGELPSPSRGLGTVASVQVCANEGRHHSRNSKGKGGGYRWSPFSGSVPSTASTLASISGSQIAVPSKPSSEDWHGSGDLKSEQNAGSDSSYRWMLFGSAPSTCSTLASSSGSQMALPARQSFDEASGGTGTPLNQSRPGEGQRPFTLTSCLQPFRGFEDSLVARPVARDAPRRDELSAGTALDTALLDEDYFNCPTSRSSEGSTDSCRSYDVVELPN